LGLMRGFCSSPSGFTAHGDICGAGSGAENPRWRLAETLKESGRGGGGRHRARASWLRWR
jgi:hypothetical protein